MIALEDAVHERAVDRPAVPGRELGKFFPSLGERRAALARPHEGVEREARDALRVRLGEERRPQRPGGDAVHEQLPRARGLEDIFAAGGEIVGAVRNVAVDRARFVGATVTLVVHAPGLEAAGREPVHHRGIGAAGDFQIESRLRGHRGAVHEEHGAAPLRARGREFLPEKQPDLVPALADPVLLPSFRRARFRYRLLHVLSPGKMRILAPAPGPLRDAALTNSRTAPARPPPRSRCRRRSCPCRAA